jgi:hypothetical protein
MPIVKVTSSFLARLRVNRIKGTLPPLASGARVATVGDAPKPPVADADGPKPVVADGEAAGPQAASATRAAIEIESAGLAERVGF